MKDQTKQESAMEQEEGQGPVDDDEEAAIQRHIDWECGTLSEACVGAG